MADPLEALKALAAGTTNAVASAATTTASGFKIHWGYVGVGAAIAVLAAALVYYVMVYSRTRPLGGDNFTDIPNNPNKKEGFYGGAAEGTGAPFCSQQSVEAAQLHALFDGRIGKAGDDVGSDDFREFNQLLGKLCCLKKDLMSPSGIVSDTKVVDYSTTSDLEPVQETAARCLAKTIPQRDLDLAFDKWNKRGTELLLHLCTAANLNEQETKDAEETFAKLWRDVYDVANTQCIARPGVASEVKIAGEVQPRDPAPYSPLALMDSQTYKSFSTGIF
jgi:hypothetical protein